MLAPPKIRCRQAGRQAAPCDAQGRQGDPRPAPLESVDAAQQCILGSLREVDGWMGERVGKRVLDVHTVPTGKNTRFGVCALVHTYIVGTRVSE